MTKNKCILIRISVDDYNKINTAKCIKKTKNEVFNLSSVVREQLSNYIDNL